MTIRHRSAISVVVLVVLAVFVLLGRWYTLRRATPALTPAALTVTVTSGGDRGAGTLREALFVADAAPGPARILIQISSLTIESALPPVINPHGIQISASPAAGAIDAHRLSAGDPVFDIDAEQASIVGVSIKGCAGTAVLVRASRFRLESSTIQSCDVGVEVAANASELALERNRLDSNRVGIRFTAGSRDTVLVKNTFSNNRDAGLWLIASQADASADSISVRDNSFNDNGTGVVLGNVPTVLEHNDFNSVRDAAVHVIGAGAVIRNNHISTGAAAGIVAENARSAIIEANELDHLQGYGMLLRGASDTLVRGNRITSGGYGMAFVLGDAHRPNTAVDNTMMDLKYDGIDVIGESPVLRHNQVAQAQGLPLRVADFSSPGGGTVRAQPLLENNSFQLQATAAQSAAKR